MPVGYHRYYSHFNTTMGEYKASGYDEEQRAAGMWKSARDEWTISCTLVVAAWLWRIFSSMAELFAGVFGDAASHSIGGGWKGKMF